ncbi:carotenoid cis-trans isomerase [hydrocarbon metagenome]|uniref:Carotenoid cis-trans isomerase n=1 Tax=hydrocarbon metagenome TaxID=938273 RepID=A0A0W8FNN5_9ZZZZ
MRHPVEGKNIVIIGSGIGGLSAGILLSLLNFQVTVVEKNPLPGGLMRSYRRSGMDCPVGVHYVGALGEKEPLGLMFHALGIPVDELFVPMGEKGIIDRYIFDDLTFDLPASIDALEDSLRKTFPQDKQALNIIMANLRKISGQMVDPSFLFSQGDPFQNMDYYLPMAELLDSLSVSAELRAILAVPCNLIGVPLSDCPVIFHHMVLASYLFSSWRLKECGSKMTDIFVSRFEELGGKLILNDGVKKISSVNGKVNGVILESGTTLFADGVVAAIHPKMLLQLLDADVLRDPHRRRIQGLIETEGVIAVNASVDAAAHPEINYNIYRLHADEKGIIQDGVFYQLRGENPSGFNLLSIITKSLYSDWSQWENTSTGKRGQEYEERKMNIAKSLVKKAEEIFGDLSSAQILDVYTPLTIRDYVNAPEGACYGIMRSSRQLLKAISLNNIPIPGLCLAGQNAIAPGVMGCMFGSFNAARQIIGAERFAQGIKRDT